MSATSRRISWLDERGDAGAVDFTVEGDMNSGVLTGDKVLAKEDWDCLLGSGGAVFLGDKRAAADLDTSGSFLNWCCSGKTFITE